MTVHPPKLVYVVTVPITARSLLRGQLAHLRRHGFDVTVVTSPGPQLDEVAAREQVTVVGVPMEREISPVRDAVALGRLYRILRAQRPDIVNASTPKAGLLGSIAALLSGVPVRIYVLRGLRLETTRGLKRRILMAAEWLTSRCAQQVVCDSHSLRRKYADLGLAPLGKLRVLGQGTGNGIDVNRFQMNPALLDAAAQLRVQLRIPSGARVIGFVGRFTRDKGVADLVEAFGRVIERCPGAVLLMVGDFEAGDPVDPEVKRRILEESGVRLTGFVPDTAPYYYLMDVLAFPSYREGFPNVPLEAAVAGVPAVGYKVTGVIDAVVDQESGLLVEAGDRQALADAIVRLLGDDGLRHALGDAARARALGDFAQETVWRHWLDFYQDCLKRTRPAVQSE